MELLQQVPFFADLPPAVQQIVIRLVALALALVVIWILRNLLTRLIMAPLRSVVGRTKNEFDDSLIEAVRRPMRIVVLGVGVAVVSEIFSFGTELDAFAANLTSALLMAAMMFFLYNLVDIIGFDSATLKQFTGIQVQDRLLPFMKTVVRVFILVMGFLIILQTFGYDISGLIASFGVVGLAFSLAAQDTAANLFGFTAIVSDNPFQVGDYIVTGDFAGVVETVGVRSTRVRKLDQSLVTVPNSYLTDKPVTNWTRLEKRRLDFYLGVTYDTNASQMRQLLHDIREMLKTRETIDAESVQVFFVEFGDSALQIRIIAYILLADWGEFTAETEHINLEIMDIVEDLGLSVAFPSRSLYIQQSPSQNGLAPSAQRELPGFSAGEVPEPSSPPEEERGTSEEKYQDNESASNEADER